MQNIKKQAGVDQVHVTMMKMAKLGKKKSCRGFWFLTLSLLPDDTITQENPLLHALQQQCTFIFLSSIFHLKKVRYILK